MSGKSAAALVVVCIVFPLLASAQKDYVVLENGDTVHGKIKKNLFGGNMRIVSKNQEIKIGENVNVYYVNKDSASYYNVIKPETGDKVFMQAVAKGEISLYTHSTTVHTYNTGSITTTNWYIEKRGTSLSLLKTTSALAGGRKERKEMLRDLISDKPEIVKLFDENDSFTFNNIRKIIAEYNKLPQQTLSTR